MSYEKNAWQTGDTITAEKLNNIENGIANASGSITATLEGASITLSASYNDVMAMLDNGIMPFTIIENEGAQVILVCAYYWAEEGSYDVSFYSLDHTATYDFMASSNDEPLIAS